MLTPFMKDGFQQGDKAFRVIARTLREEHVRRLQEAGIDVASAEQSKQLEMRSWARGYLREGQFDHKVMLALIQGALDAGRQEGFRLVRFIADMEWTLEERVNTDDLLQLEAEVNTLLSCYPDDPVI